MAFIADPGIRVVTAGSKKTAPGLPQPNRIKHHWDFTDLSQLSQDAAGLVPVANQGDPIARVDDKGFDNVPLLQSVTDRQPTLDVSTHNLAVASFNNSVLIAAAIPTGLGSAFWGGVAFWELLGGAAAEQVIYRYDTIVSDRLAVTTQPNAPSGAATQAFHTHRISGDQESPSAAAGFFGVNEFNAAIDIWDATPFLSMIANIRILPITDTNANDPPANGADVFVGGDTDASPPSLPFVGRLGEVIIYDGTTVFSAQEIQRIKSYGTFKYDTLRWAG